MKFLSIELENFGPYFGRQSVDLKTTTASPVILMHGENMRGKTNFFQALRWCLYGKVKNQAGDDLGVSDFANWDRRDSGEEFKVSVALEVEDSDRVYTLTRWATCLRDEANPMAVRVLEQDATLVSADKNAIPSADIEDRVNEMLSEAFSDLFLFDGETLRDYENKLKNPGLSQDLVRTSIEKALGLPALTTVVEDLRALRGAVDKELKASLKDEKEAQAGLAAVEKLQGQLDAIVDDLRRTKEIANEASARKDQLQPQMDSNASLREQHAKRAALVNEIEDLEMEILEDRSRIAGLLKSSFWLPCEHIVQSRLAAVNDELDVLVTARSEQSRSVMRAGDIADSLHSGMCVVCMRPLDASTRNALTDLTAEDASGSAEPLEGESRLEALQVMRRELSALAESNGKREQMQDVDARLRRSLIKLEDRRQKLADLKRILDANASDFGSVEAEYNQVIQKIENCRKMIPELESRKVGVEEELKALRNGLKVLAGDSSPIKQRLDVIDGLATIFEESRERFTERMREEVEVAASRIFRDITTEPEYQGLRIQRTYYLQIVDRDDRVVLRRSAGAELVVAMALIGALVECAVSEAPVVVDTPFGRLDLGHRRRLLQWVPSLGNQVILFVHSGEIPADYRQILGTKIGREFSLRRISATHTEIERYRHE